MIRRLAVVALLAGCSGTKPPVARPTPVPAPPPAAPAPPPPPPTVDASPAAPTGVTPAPELIGPSWVLTMLQGAPVAPGNRGKRATLRLTDDGVAAGFAGCNQFTARFTNSDTRLRVKPAVTTKMSCTRGMTLERDYLAALERVDGWRRNGFTLELVDGDEVVAIYERP